MESSGIIRRIDDLGRIVIPREYRKSLRIDLGDPIEITALESGEILLKKVDTSGELVKNAKKIISQVENEIDGTWLITDGETWLWGKGENKNAFISTPVNKWVRQAVKERKTMIDEENSGELVGGSEHSYAVFIPAVANGDCYGGICVLGIKPFTIEQSALVSLLGKILGEFMNKY